MYILVQPWQTITIYFGNLCNNITVTNYISKGKTQLVLFLIWDVLPEKAQHYADGTLKSLPDTMSC